MSVSARKVGVIGLGATLAAVCALVLAPSHPDVGALWSDIERTAAPLERLGLPSSLMRPGVLEFGSNILMFVPLGLFGALALPRRLWWLVALACFALTCAIETTQLLLLPGRTFDVTDIIGNAAGGLFGAVLAWSARAARSLFSGSGRRVAAAR
ncbi:VanZ family protein [Gryllotalpicola koreensis]|uniref:VanZ-like domain-containing protein n=1 Tax=Gryllotalpicola koreensis TaxID=993086 RepID=A0ABP8A0G6_9MICO